MNLWPRFGVWVRVRMCVNVCDVCQSSVHCLLSMFAIHGGREAEQKCIADAPTYRLLPREPEFAPKGINVVRRKKGWWMCVVAQSKVNAEPGIILSHSFMHLWKSQRGKKGPKRRTEADKLRIHHWQSYLSLVYALTGLKLSDVFSPFLFVPATVLQLVEERQLLRQVKPLDEKMMIKWSLSNKIYSGHHAFTCNDLEIWDWGHLSIT